MAPINWALRLERVFAIDIEAVRSVVEHSEVIACIEDPQLIAKILANVRSREAVTAQAVARAPPRCDGARRWLK